MGMLWQFMLYLRVLKRKEINMCAVKTLRTCPKGHQYYKSTDCPTCPVCESERLSAGIFSGLGAPAQRALENNGISTLQQLSTYSEREILKFHGMGPASMPK